MRNMGVGEVVKLDNLIWKWCYGEGADDYLVVAAHTMLLSKEVADRLLPKESTYLDLCSELGKILATM